METNQFDAAAYKRIRLPWLLLALFLSLAADAILFIVWEGGVSPSARFYWDVGFAFFGFLNLLFMKGAALHRYFYVKKLRAESYVRTGENEVAHYLLRSRMSRRQVEAAKETRFPAGGKEEYISADTFRIRHVKRLMRRPDGSILIEGNVDCESFSEGWEEYSADRGKVFRKTIRRHRIPAYYEGMDAILRALDALK